MSYYKQNIPGIIEKCKAAMKQCLDIVDQEIDGTLSDDKLHNALKGKRMATEDAKWYAKQVDELEKEMNDEDNNDKTKINRAKRIAQQQ